MLNRYTVNYLRLLLLGAALNCFCQWPKAQDCLHERHTHREAEWNDYMAMASAAENLKTDNNIDVTFYHIDISVDIDTKTIGGSVYVELTPTINNLQQVTLNLHNSLTVNSVSEDAISVTPSTNTITMALSRSFNIGETVKLRIFYQGSPISPNGVKGFRFTTNSYGVPVAVTLSTPYLAHYWYPCKDGPSDKPDKVYVDITIPQKTYAGRELIAVSNGVLNQTTTSGETKTFKWRHNHPIVPYYVMVAISNYDIINQTYNRNSHNIPLTYYVFPSEKSNATTGVANIPLAFDAFIKYFGDYPFKNEKYGMTQIGFYGGIENQTNSIINSMSSSWFNTSVHELAHMWFGCSVTCQDWHHAWINEGFASYAEALYYEHVSGMAAYHNHMATMRFTEGGTVYLTDDSDPFNVFQNIVYDKGAWVLHMLRHVLGDEAFFNCLKSFAQSTQFKYKNATTEDFRLLCEGISGQNLYNFFDQWIYDEYYPIYYFNFYSDLDEGKAGITLHQKQADYGDREVFEMPVQLKLNFSDGTSTTVKVNNTQRTQTYYFDINKTVSSINIDPSNWILKEAYRSTSLSVPRAPSSKKLITGFTIPGQSGATAIDQTNKAITLSMPYGTSVAALQPNITISAKASVSPPSGAAQNFSAPVAYRVTAEDGTSQDYSVTVTVLKNPAKLITAFDIPGQSGNTAIDQTNRTITVAMPYGTNVTALVPTITVSEKASVSPPSGAAQNFSAPVAYRVTAEDGTSQDYSVTVTVLKNPAKLITAFDIPGQSGNTAIDQTNRTITVAMPYGTNVTALAPTITVSEKASVSPPSGAAQNFSAPVAYRVTAEDGTSQDYSVTVTVLKNPAKLITAFSIPGQSGNTAIDQTNRTITVAMPYGTNVTALVPTITVSEKASVSPPSGAAQNFSAPVAYRVTAEDGTSQDYSVTVTVLKNPAKLITAFDIPGQSGNTAIDQTNRTITVAMPYGTNVTALAPTITVSEKASVSPPSGAAQNFSAPVAYRVTAEDGTSQDYSVTVTVLKNPAKLITAFNIPGQSGNTAIDQTNKTIALSMPYGTDVTALVPNIQVSEKASVSPMSGAAQNFSAPVAYRVTAEDGTSQDYSVTVTVLKNPAKLITAFNIPGQSGNTAIDQTNKTIALSMPYGTNATALVPSVQVSEKASVSPMSGVAQNFSAPVAYRVTAEDGTSQDYSVTVTVLKNPAKLITAFNIPGQSGNTAIDQTNKTIALSMPYGTDATALVPSVQVSEKASVSPMSGVAQNFSAPVAYRVTAEDGTSQDYSVTVTVLKNPAKLITAFSIPGQSGNTAIDQTNKTIALSMPYGTNVTALVPTITVSEKASVSPPSGAAQNFSAPVAYRVTAEDGTSQDYSVTVTVLKNPAKLITAFSIPGQSGNTAIDQTNKTIALSMPYGTNVTALVPTITVSEKASVSPPSGAAQNFSAPVAYRVTAEDGTSQDYSVTVTVLKNPAKLITAFDIPGQSGNTAIDQTNRTITVAMPYGTNVTALVPTITVSEKASVSPPSGAAQNFSAPVAYRVTAEDGTSQDYSVTVTVLKNPAKLITAFSIPGQSGNTAIDQTNKTIALSMPYGTNVTALVPTITVSEKASVSPPSGAAQNFSAPVAYRVTAEDGTSQDYSVTVTVLKNPAKLITAFDIPGQSGNTAIDQTNRTITVAMPYGTNVTALVPTITVSEKASVSPPSGAAQNFSAPVAYRVTAEDGTSQDYSVTVTVLKNPAKLITAFDIPGQSGNTAIDQTNRTITVAMPYGTNVTALVPTITVSEKASVSPPSGAAQNFSAPVAYRVTAEDGTSQDYSVTVTVLKNPAKLITAFDIPGQSGNTAIDQTNRTITVAMPYGTNVTALAPTITVSEKASVSPPSGAAQNFSAPVAYRVTAEDGTSQDYSVTVTVLKNPAKLITAFSIPGQSGNTAIDQTNKTIALSMPYGTNVTALAPTITVSEKASVSPPSGAAQNFSAPVAYRVTAEDGTSQDYSVTVTVLKNPAKLITAFDIPGQSGNTAIDQTNRTITVAMPYGTNVTALVPTITVSEKASVSPPSGAAQNFSAPVAYRVTAEDGTSQDYSVTVTVLKNPAKLITAFDIPGQSGNTAIDQTNRTITVAMPYGTNVTALVPTITVSEKASVSPPSGAAQNFSAPVAYRVTAEDGTSQDYSVTVTVLKNPAKLITAFDIPGQSGNTAIDQTNRTITVAMPYGTNVTALVPTITVSEKASVSPPSGAAQNFSAPVAYRVTAEDGTSQDYSVTVTVLKNPAKLITAFDIPGQSGNTAIDQTNRTITVAMPYGTNVTALAPTITVSEKASVSPPSGAAQNFSAPVAYRVTAEDGTSQDYSVTVTVLKNPAKLITAFSIPGQSGNTAIDQTNRTITVAMPYGTNVTALVPTITVSEKASVSPPSGAAQNFSAPVAYRVTAEDGTSQDYSVTVTVLKNPAKLITAFDIPGQSGNTAIDQTNRTITVAMPYGTNVTALAPTITVSEKASVSPMSGAAQNFSAPVAYRVTAEDGTSQDYSVTVTVLKNPAKLITAFNIPGQSGNTAIDQTNKTIALSMPYGTNATALVPSVQVSEKASVSPMSGVAQNFSAPVAYRVTAEDGTSQDYSVTVTVLKNPAKLITAFNIPGQSGNTAIDQTNKTIALSMPYGTDATALVPSVQVSEKASVSPMSGVAQNFSAPVAYRVTAEDGTSQDYSVTVTVLKNPAKLITAFSIPGQSGNTAIDQTNKTIALSMPYGTNVTALVPTITVSEKASVSPPSGAAQNFSAPVAYRVTAEDGTSQDYSVTVTVLKNPAKLITAFSIPGQSGNTAIDQTNKTIALSMPYGTNVTALVPTITVSEKASVSPPSGAAQNFSAPVAYRVTAEDGTSQDYSVTVTVLKNPAKLITAFDIPGQSGNTAIDQTNRTITVAMPYGTNVTALVPTITVSEKASVSPPSGAAQNFSAPVAYRVTAEDGTSQDYSVTVTVLKNPAKLITAFSIPGQSGNTAIDQTNKTIALSMPYGTNVTALVPTITVSEKASVSPPSGAAQNFSAPVAYRVTAEDGTSQDYSVTVTVLKNPAKLITAFDIPGQSGNTAIDQTNRTITVAMPYGTNVTALVPTITVSEKASVSPPSGAAQNFSAPVAYRVTAEDGTSQDYSVTVTVLKNPAKLITAFDIPGQSGNTAIDQTNRTITVAMPYGTNVTALVPTITVSEKASVSPPSGAAQNFSAPVAYRVTAEDGTSQDYSVTVTVLKNPAKLITAFSIPGQSGNTAIDQTNKTIALSMPYGTNVTALAPTITVSEKASVSPPSGAAQNFSAPVAYRVTAEDGTSQDYSVTVTVLKNPAKLITAFDIPGQSGNTAIDQTNRTITVAMPYGTNVTALVPTITVSEKASVSPPSGAAQNFSAPVAYRVTAEDGTSQDYSVTVTVLKNPAKLITAFDIPGQSGNTAIDQTNRTITVAMPYGTNVTALVPTITVSEKASVSPPSGAAQNFSAPVAYRVTAEDGTSQDYSVTVTVLKNPAKLITAFDIPGQSGNTAIDQTNRTITVAMPYGTNVTALVPTITVSEKASVSPPSGAAQNFSAPVAYRVTAEDGTSQDYSVTVTVLKNPAKLITAFDIPGQSGNTAIDQTNRTITVAMPYGTNVTALAPTITVSEKASVSPPSGAAQNFSAPVAYRVTAEDGTSQDYSVTVTVLKNPAKLITAFSIPGQSGNTAIDQTNRTITVAMPYGTNVTALVPTITVSEKASVSPPSGAAQNFSAPVAYRVTAEDGTSQDYSVTVTVLKNPAKLITAFDIPGQSGNTAIDQTNRTITVAMPYGTNVTALAPTITVSEKASVSPPSGAAQNFSAPVAYRVTAEDGTSQDYSVTVTVLKNPAKLITAFDIPGQSGNTAIDQTNKTIALSMPYGTDVTALVPNIQVSEKASVSPMSGAAQNFSAPVAYRVTAEDGTSQDYSVTVTVLKNPAKLITAFNIPGQSGNTAIDQTNRTINVVMPFGTNKSALTPTIVISQGASINPASGVTRNFNSTVKYTVTAENGSTQDYSVTVTNQKNNKKQILSFSIIGQLGTSIIDESSHTVTATMPYGTDITALAPEIRVSDEASVTPASKVARNFSSPLKYKVTAEDETWQEYTVKVSLAKNDANDILMFNIEGQMEETEINPISHTVKVKMPNNSNLKALSPSVVVSPNATFSPAEGSIVDFSRTVEYTVTSESGISRVWKVNVTSDISTNLPHRKGLEVMAYPNPTKHLITIRSNEAITQVVIYKLNGNLMDRLSYPQLDVAEINMSHYGKGVFLLQVITHSGKELFIRAVVEQGYIDEAWTII